MTQDTMIGITIIIFILTLGALLGFVEYADHLEAMAKIEQGCEELAND